MGRDDSRGRTEGCLEHHIGRLRQASDQTRIQQHIAAQDQDRAFDLLGIDDRQVGAHVEIGAGRHRVAVLQLRLGKRDRDLRDVLDTKKWPKASFAGTLSPPVADTSAAHSYAALARGTFSLHGVERAVEVPAKVVLDSAYAQIDARFALRLIDYQIEAPSLAAFIKVSEEVDVSVRVRMKDIAQVKE